MVYPILVVEDDPKIAHIVKVYLEGAGFRVIHVDRGTQALEEVKKEKPLLVILDLMLPDMSGEEVCLQLKEFADVPIIMLTAKSSEEERVAGFALGADDYVVKPFSPREVVARVKAVLRRCARPSHVLHLSGLTLDQDAHTVSCDGQRVPLTYKEYELLRLFLSHPGMAFTRDQLMAQVWGTDYCGETRTVDMHIRTLRQKLGPYGSLIQTVRNVGYRLEEQE